jgi:hypothetical protein
MLNALVWSFDFDLRDMLNEVLGFALKRTGDMTWEKTSMSSSKPLN